MTWLRMNCLVWQIWSSFKPAELCDLSEAIKKQWLYFLDCFYLDFLDKNLRMNEYLIFKKSQATVNEDDVGDLNIAFVENVVAASWSWFKAARIRHWEVATDGGCPVVIVADAVVVASTAVKVALHGIPLCSDVVVDSISEKWIQMNS